MDRGVRTYSASYLLGTATCFLIPLSPAVTIATTALLLLSSCLFKKKSTIFLLCSHLAIYTCGAGICSIAQERALLPQNDLSRAITKQTENMQHKIAGHLWKFVPDSNSHAVLCALSIGERNLIDRDLKKSFSTAGAMHVLALSGLHIGITFAIIYAMLLPLIAIPGGRWLRNITALLFICGYCIIAGCSPSVVRAATMIILYKIAAGKFRSLKNWDAIAISAMILATISPLQVKSIGFQLSYCAVIGIALLYPVCDTAFRQLIPKWKGWNRYLWHLLYWLWGSLAISVCCQITTIPVSLYHFGYSAPYFLLANLAAVPLATAILYSLTITLCIQWFPLIGDWSVYILNALIKLLIITINFISG